MVDRPEGFGNFGCAAAANDGWRLREQRFIRDDPRKIIDKGYADPVIPQDRTCQGQDLIRRQRPGGAQSHRVGALRDLRIDLEGEVKGIAKDRVDKRQQRHLFDRHVDRRP